MIGAGVVADRARGVGGRADQASRRPAAGARSTALPALAERVGHDIVTSDGTTLLGADDKAGIAEIMAAVAYLAGHPERPRAPVRVAFTVDEEVGRGAEDFDLDAFGADVAYTLDGSGLGELEVETFSAESVRVTIRGLSVHPGSAKGKLVNAVKLASELVISLPRTGSRPRRPRTRRALSTRIGSPATRRRRSSTSSPATTTTSSSRSTSSFFAARATEVEVREPRAHVEIEVRHSYRNMRPFIEENPRVVDAALEAIRRAGSSRGSRSRAAAPTAPSSLRRACRRRTSSPAGRSTTRCASGRACRTWPQRPRRSSSSPASGRNRRSQDGSSRLKDGRPVARLVGINHVAVEVGDIDEMLAFLEQIFDACELRGRSGGMAFVDLGDQFIALELGGRPFVGWSLRPRRRR